MRSDALRGGREDCLIKWLKSAHTDSLVSIEEREWVWYC